MKRLLIYITAYIVLCLAGLVIWGVRHPEPLAGKQAGLTITTKFVEVSSGPNTEELSFDWIIEPLGSRKVEKAD